MTQRAEEETSQPGWSGTPEWAKWLWVSTPYIIPAAAGIVVGPVQGASVIAVAILVGTLWFAQKRVVSATGVKTEFGRNIGRTVKLAALKGAVRAARTDVRIGSTTVVRDEFNKEKRRDLPLRPSRCESSTEAS